MSLKRWIARLRKIQRDELGHRTHEAYLSANDRILGVRKKFPKHLLKEKLPQWPLPLELEQWTPELHHTADKILSEDWMLLNESWDLKKPWGWDNQHQWAWSMEASPIGLLGRAPVGIDVKFAWEPLRLDGLLILALAGFTGHQTAYTAALSLWRRLLLRHQPFKGVLYTSGIDGSFRLIKSLLLNCIFESDYTEEDRHQVWQLLWGHQQWLRRYPSLYSSGNNHRIGELAGLAVLEAMAPFLPDAQPQNIAYELLQHTRLLTHEDGVYVEQSLYYQATIMEWLLLVRQIVGTQSIYFPIEPVLGYLTTHMLSMLGEEGQAPMIGDVDDSYVLPMLGASDFMRSVSQASAALLNMPVPFQAKSDFRSRLLCLENPHYQSNHAVQNFPYGGLSQLITKDSRLLIDHGPLGYERLAAHGHADTLSVWLFHQGRPVWVDFGSYAYAAAPDWRDWSRSTAAHNTIEINHESSSVPLGAFGWRERAQAYLLSREAQKIVVAHDGYEKRFGIRHTRTISLHDEGVRVVDQIDGTGEHHLRLSYLLGDGLLFRESDNAIVCNETGQVFVWIDASVGSLALKSYYGDDSEEGWQATGYMRKQPITRLNWTGQTKLPLCIDLFWRWA